MGVRVTDLPPQVAARLGLAPEPTPKQNKFSAKRTCCAHGHTHASKAEARRCDTLHLLQRAGSIRGLEQQPKFYFTMPDGRQVRDERNRAIRYTADFRFEELTPRGWSPVVEDVKSRATMTEAATLRIAFFRAFHPDIELREVA